MAIITWNDTMSVGIEELDKHHKKLIELINSLHDAMSAGKGHDTLGGIFDELLKYTKYHFSAEEKLFATHKYPDLASHKTEHDKLTKQAEELAQKHKSGQIALTIPAMHFLRDWLNGHIMGTDKKYGPFLNSKGVR